MKFGLRLVGAGSLVWLFATACGDTTSGDGSTGGVGGDSGSVTTSAGTATGGSSASEGTTSTTAGSTNSGTGTLGTGGTSAGSCPDIEPAPGTSCNDQGLACDFVHCGPPDYRDDRTLTCVGGAWELSAEAACMPPNCPATAPEIGSPCSTPSGPCPVSDACGTSYLYCVDGSWSSQVGSGADVPQGAGGSANLIAAQCPAEPPAQGTTCCPGWYPSYCDYSSGVGGSGAGFAPLPTTTTTTNGQGGAGGVAATSAGGATGSGAAGGSEGMGGTGATGTTGASALSCATCDPGTQRWEESADCD